MNVRFLGRKGTWRQVANSANTTINRAEGTKEPSDKWKKRILLAEHSPIRQLTFKLKWYNLKYWVSVHIVRHKFGIEHFVRSQRTDRTNIDRNELRQDALVEHEIEAGTQAMINISRKRLCKGASPETIEAWKEILKEVQKVDDTVYKACVPDCVYRGHCYEFVSCGYHKTENYKKALQEYREGINE